MLRAVFSLDESRGAPPGRWGMQHSPCVERLRDWILFSLERRWTVEELPAAMQCLWGGQRWDGDSLFAAVCGGKMRGGGHKLKREAQMAYKENSFTLRAVKQGNMTKIKMKLFKFRYLSS